jgi:hypothetical protein
MVVLARSAARSRVVACRRDPQPSDQVLARDYRVGHRQRSSWVRFIDTLP